jgi:cellobiose phosphorylase
VILGLAGFDREEAWKRLKNMTLANMSKQFPDYWSSYWSASDNQESSLIPEEGLPDQSYDYSNIPVICAHPHAWILYCYYYLKDKQ